MGKGTKATKDKHLAYGEGQREQYGEGTRYRKEETKVAADTFNEHGFAGGKRRAKKSVPDPRKPEGD
jgi:hypothetical protein